MTENFTPQWLGFELRTSRGVAMIVDEDIYDVWLQTDDRKVRRMDKPVFFERLGKDETGYYLAVG